jgi:selenocysteine lyase/cysteine desulfurase
VSTDPTRRLFLGSLGATAIPAIAPAADAGVVQPPSADTGTDRPGDAPYLFAPGLTYLNTASLGPTPRAVLDRTLDAWRELETNPVYMAYGKGPAHVAADRTRTLAADLLACTADEILITRSTTDAMNSLALNLRLARGDRVLLTDQEHEGGSVGWQFRARRDEVRIDTIPIATTDHDPAAIVRRFAEAITPQTRVISVSHVIASTGLRMPIPEIAALAKRHGALCIVDGAQAVGQIAVDVKALGCHAYATSGHKWLMGPKGTGLLYVDREATGIELVQWENGRTFISNSTGIGSLPLVSGLGVAIEAMKSRGLAAVERHNIGLRNRAYGALQEMKLSMAGPPPGPLATAMVAAMLPSHVDSAQVRDTLREKHGIVIKMIEKRWFNGIRLSPHVFNNEADIDKALGALRLGLA